MSDRSTAPSSLTVAAPLVEKKIDTETSHGPQKEFHPWQYVQRVAFRVGSQWEMPRGGRAEVRLSGKVLI